MNRFRFTSTFFALSLFAFAPACAGPRTKIHADAVAAGGVRVSPSDVFANGSVLVVRVNVLNDANAPLTLDQDAARLTLPDGRILMPASHANKTKTIEPHASELVRIDFRSDGFKWKEIPRAQLKLADAMLVRGAPSAVPPMDLIVGEVKGEPLAKIEAKQITISEQVQFKTDSAEIMPESDPLLDAIAGVLASNPKIASLRVEGHTDSRGNVKSNKELSKRRAASVVAALVARGIARERLKSAGFGDTKPIDSNETDDGRRKNRRVELHIED